MSYIEIRDLHFAYEGEEALSGISLSIEKGEFVAILGHNGSGKSTLAKLLTMVIDDYETLSGSIKIDGIEIADESISDEDIYSVRRRVGMVFQNPDNQIVATVVEEDVAFGPENLGIEREEIRRRVDEALSAVGMTEYAKHEPHRLSGGQKQRVAIAGILAMHPECVIFDESTAMLDPIGRRDVNAAMEKLNREGITVINITHYMDEAVRASRVVVLDDGRVILDGVPSDIFKNSERLRASGLDLTQSAELAEKLSLSGIRLSGDVSTPERLADAIMEKLK